MRSRKGASCPPTAQLGPGSPRPDQVQGSHETTQIPRIFCPLATPTQPLLVPIFLVLLWSSWGSGESLTDLQKSQPCIKGASCYPPPTSPQCVVIMDAEL